jgi:hypothetical protein
MPPNIVFTLNETDRIQAKLVDFELAQSPTLPCPAYVNDTVAELYRERDVPINRSTSAYQSTLDMHLIDQSIELIKRIGIARGRPAVGTMQLDTQSLQRSVHVIKNV